ncbi:uncharacterized protein LOC120350324 [Nilaparvata lugens]|uniref:uncharacterized protein LOC120350324 n=1 Tax=Nilaparvata lugens TaxID=108931 RepID=UPI00193E6712|nr:uncharacterized protein LOC120350324 [Nilaparvata lugens]
MSSFSNNSGGSSSGATNAPLKEDRKQSLQPCDRDNQLPTLAIIGRNENDHSRKTQNLLKSKKYETFDDPAESSRRCEVGESHVPPEPAAKKEVHFELPPSSRDHNEASAGFRSHYGTPSHQGKAYLETNLDSSCASERRSSTPTLNVAVSSCNEVGTSLWLTSGSGGSGSDFTRGAQTFGAQKCDAQKCDVFARGGRQDSPPPDYWNQVGQQVPFIDSSGGSVRNSLLINQSATGGGSGYQILVDRSAVNQPPGSDSTSLNSAPSSPPPSSLTPPTTSTSFRDQSRKKRPKLSRFYSQHDPDCPPAEGSSL